MNETISILYLIFIFWICAWQGFEFTYQPGKEHKEIIGYHLKITKNKSPKPAISHLYILIVGPLLMIMTLLYGGVAYLIQIAIYDAIKWAFNINLQIWPETTEYLLAFIYGLIALFGFNFGKACYLSFAKREFIRLINNRDSDSNPFDEMNVDKAINENLQR
jgi:hypothetical protein